MVFQDCKLVGKWDAKRLWVEQGLFDLTLYLGCVLSGCRIHYEWRVLLYFDSGPVISICVASGLGI